MNKISIIFLLDSWPLKLSGNSINLHNEIIREKNSRHVVNRVEDRIDLIYCSIPD
jgi:hypothetical protein